MNKFENYKNRILLSVTGMSPAVVTETLYALVTEKNFIPTEIKVITTQQGKNKLLESLLGIVGGRKEKEGALSKFIKDYGKKYQFNHIHFDENSIIVIEDQSGQKLGDIRSADENTLASDQIVSLVGNLCQNEETALHVSIAGGRKTMGFFLGYALSLYGREQDSLSHVLVDEIFENVPDFYYPTPTSYKINDRNGREIDATNAKVMLAEIPWVRLGLGVPDDLKENKITYSESVAKAQALLKTPSLTFVDGKNGIGSRLVKFGDKEITLTFRGYALLLGLVIAKFQGWDFSANIDDPKEMERSKEIYFKIYNEIKPNEEKMQERIAFFFKEVLSDSRTDIRKKLQDKFSLAKNTETPYLPRSNKFIYELFIDIEHIDISLIKHRLLDIDIRV
ncbi:CRISPR-associated ring nuclease Csm6 [Pasteurella atlantica]|uniref:CRISPR-associated ring nuclease Csm6 n=2 Tax=Pasteurellaceae TaxID=712 RepID=A0ACC6HPH9_9PAST|nr:CRISPR-associated ring nuclease Csm6 [Pasteurella atlantica]MDP8052782.1 CRISPR-associated ring nuclease Csm6 [Pasteurella atlantica]MDP8106079.1 CRISPR-associated ring nuclease Csm6 [Pasteurella atlantica]MDP8149473.1 CRISPR-associated ring nuclease Csm6 [Pasteurella atlantica]